MKLSFHVVPRSGIPAPAARLEAGGRPVYSQWGGAGRGVARGSEVRSSQELEVAHSARWPGKREVARWGCRSRGGKGEEAEQGRSRGGAGEEVVSARASL